MIGRANLDGSAPEPAFVTGLRGPVGIAVDGAHLYWTETESGTIGRANLDGSGVDEGLLTGLAGPVEVAVDANHIYWTNNSANTVGRAALDGSGADLAFIPTLAGPSGVAVNAPLGDAQAKGRQAQRGRRIRVRVEVTAGETLSAYAGGRIRAGGKRFRLRPKTVEVATHATRVLTLRPRPQVRGRIARRLRSGKRTVAKLYVALNDGAGNGFSERLRVNLRR